MKSHTYIEKYLCNLFIRIANMYPSEKIVKNVYSVVTFDFFFFWITCWLNELDSFSESSELNLNHLCPSCFDEGLSVIPSRANVFVTFFLGITDESHFFFWCATSVSGSTPTSKNLCHRPYTPNISLDSYIQKPFLIDLALIKLNKTSTYVLHEMILQII